MWKKIMKDYWWEFSLIKIKELWKSGQVYWVAGFIIFAASLCNSIGFPKGMVLYGLGVLPFFFQLLSGQLHSIKMPKIFYLCPMEESTRRRFITGRMICNIGIPALAGALGTLGLVAMHIADAFWALLFLFNFALSALIICGFNEWMIKQEKKTGISEWTKLKAILCLIICIYSNIFSVIFLAESEGNELKLPWLICTLSLSLPLAWSLRKAWKEEWQRAFVYED